MFDYDDIGRPRARSGQPATVTTRVKEGETMRAFKVDATSPVRWLGVLAIVTAFCQPIIHARELGVDVSHFQGETGMPQANWNQLAAEGRTFAYIKATEGLSPPGNIDPAFATNVSRAQSAGILAGVYHFARPDNRPLPSGAVAEADHYINTAGSAMNAGNLRPVLDVERQAVGMTQAALTDWVLAFNDEVVRLKGPAAEPIVYMT